ncbi:hypothetical protein PLESTF_001724200 [Pleodorina starrii]|nr:hypothetical protein PLESTF_001724200 [Pleodorina starrii]
MPTTATATAPTAGKAAPMGGTMARGRMRECIDNCRDCETICEETISHCLNKGGAHAQPDFVLLLADCAVICRTSARFMIHGSLHHVHTCGACAKVCDACADDCESLMGATGGGREDDIMRKCADMCRTCAKSCAKMAATAGGGSA